MKSRLTFARGEDPCPVVTAGDIAERSGMTRDTVYKWITRGLGTPEPVGQSIAGALYWWPDWLEWFRAKRPAIYEAIANGATRDSGGDDDDRD